VRTNGHTLHPRNVLRLLEEVDPYMAEVSLHGATAEVHDRQTRVPGSFATLMRNVREMRELGLRFKFNVPLTRFNEHQIEAIFAIADGLGVSLLVDPAITPRDNGDRSPLDLTASPSALEQLQQLAARRSANATKSEPAEIITPPNKHCGSGSSTVTVDPVGNVYPCVQLRRAAGSLQTQSIKEIWHQSQVLDEVRDLTQRVKEWMDGLGPDARPTGFCPGTALAEMGDATALYPVASLRRELAQRAKRADAA
jgi:MoaA/NifB/PqqE/SkfB family radical SAM enzyme